MVCLWEKIMFTTFRRVTLAATLTLALGVIVPAASGALARVPANTVYEVQVAGTNGIPADASTAALQVTVTNPLAAGHVTAYPCGVSRPPTSTVNFSPGQTRSNLALTGIGADGKVCLYTLTSTDLVVDVSGWFAGDSGWTRMATERVIDTRDAGARVAGGSVLRVDVASAASVPSDARAAAFNLTAVDARAPGYLTVFRCGSPVPTASSVNFLGGRADANLAVAELDRGATCIYASADAHVIVDVVGWTSATGVLDSAGPTRVADTRLGQGGWSLGAGTTRRVRVGSPANGAAVVNLTAVDGGAGYLTAHECGSPLPGSSNVNYAPGTATSTLAIVRPDASGDVCVFASQPTHLVVDLYAWMRPSSGYQVMPAKRLLDTRTTSGGSRAPDVGSNLSKWEYLATGERIPPSSASEPSGSFRTFCGFSHLSYDDPIVYPGQRGAAHLHMYFGNTAADAHSTYQSLRSSGNGTCQGGPLNRSGYWVPAMHNAAGQVVVPDYFEIYYKGNGSAADISSMSTYPNGLRMIAGHDMAKEAMVRGGWSCSNGAPSLTIPSCGAGQTIRVELRFPMCWDGRNLDAADHRSHMAYGTGGGGWVTRQGGCPASHPIHVPELTVFANFTSDGNSQNWYLSSDRAAGHAHPNGSTFHADWFGAWDNGIQETWTQECIREMRSCVWGELGDGTRLIDGPNRYDGPRLLPAPPR